MKTISLFATILFSSVLTAQNLSNGGFENFGTQSYTSYQETGTSYNPTTCMQNRGTRNSGTAQTGNNRPIGFRTTDDIVTSANPFYATSTSTAHSGSSAIRLTDDGFFGFGIVGLFDVETLANLLYPVAYPFSGIPDSLSGFYRHSSGSSVTFPANTCTNQGRLTQSTTFVGGFRVFVEIYDSLGAVIAKIDTTYPDAATYTAFSAPVQILNATASPAQILMVMSHSPEFMSPNQIPIFGSTTFIDDVDFIFNTVSIAEIDGNSSVFDIYPNPASNELTIRSSVEDQEVLLFDMRGSILSRIRMNNTTETIDLTKFSPGIYFVKNGEEVKKLVIQ
jgi:hypothetical protein